jgi:hypothetical protein
MADARLAQDRKEDAMNVEVPIEREEHVGGGVR